MKNDIGKILITEAQIQSRVAELAGQINRDYENEEIIFVGILRGSCYFLCDLTQVYHVFFSTFRHHTFLFPCLKSIKPYYLNIFTNVAIIVAIEAVEVPMVKISAVFIFVRCGFVGTTISQPG